jgi:serine protease Do
MSKRGGVSFMIKTTALVTAIVLAALPALAQEAGWVGISIEDQKDNGAIVRMVEPNSPAEKAGLRQGDVILQYNKQDVSGVQQLTRLVRETPVGRTVELKIRRDNRDQTLNVTTEKTPDNLGRLYAQLPDARVLRDRITRSIPQVRVYTIFTKFGIQVEQMPDQLRDYFGVSGSYGVLVTSVDKNSAAERGGVKAGDVITSIDGKSIRTPADFNREMRGGAALKVFRDKQERELKVE